MQKQSQDLLSEEGKRNARKRAGTAGVIAALVYIGLFITAMSLREVQKDDHLSWNSPAIWAFGLIVLAPPVWFFFESLVIYGHGHVHDEEYKHTQELSSRIWIACSAIVGLYLFHKSG